MKQDKNITYMEIGIPNHINYDVYLNNIKQRHCMEANVKEGWIRTYIITNEFRSKNTYKVDFKSDTDGMPITKLLYGNVIIREK